MFADIDKYIAFLLDLSVWLYTHFNVFFSMSRFAQTVFSYLQVKKAEGIAKNVKKTKVSVS